MEKLKVEKFSNQMEKVSSQINLSKITQTNSLTLNATNRVSLEDDR
jgi:hypothetical protein